MDEQQIRQIINDILSDSFAKRIGDTPTDALQLVNKKYVDAHKGYAGRVADTGAAILLPKGWSSVQNGTGDYTVTHNLGNTNYSVVINLDGGRAATIIDASANSFRYQTIGGSFNEIAYFIVATA